MNKPSKSKAAKPKIVVTRDLTPDYERARQEDISRMEAAQQRFGRLRLEDRKPSYWDRVMSDPNRKDRYDDALLEAQMEAQRAFDGEDAEEWQEWSERQGDE